MCRELWPKRRVAFLGVWVRLRASTFLDTKLSQASWTCSGRLDRQSMTCTIDLAW